MTIKEVIEAAEKQIAAAQRKLTWIREHQAQLATAGVQDLDPISTVMWLDINRPSRETAVKVIEQLGGKWEKERAYETHLLNYRAVIDGMNVRLWCAPPPPSCRLVEEEYE